MLDEVTKDLRQGPAWRGLKRSYFRLCAHLPDRLMRRNRYIDKFRAQRTPAQMLRTYHQLIRSERGRSDINELHRYVGINSWQWFDSNSSKALLQEALGHVPLEYLSEDLVRRANRLRVPLPVSFRACISLRSKKTEFGLPCEWQLNDKRAGYRFADRLGVPRPGTFQETIPFSAIEPRSGIVIKPTAGAASSGVFTVDSGGQIYDVQRSAPISGWAELREIVTERRRAGELGADRWLVEALVAGREPGRPATDMKCYAFYGRVALILQVSRNPSISYRWLNRQGQPVDTGVYQETFQGSKEGLPAGITLADRISSEIPAPFVRIDLLDGKNGPVLGEFTPRPGSYHKLNRATDQWLGELFLMAEEHLISDLLNGKRFEYFNDQFITGTSYSAVHRTPTGTSPPLH